MKKQLKWVIRIVLGIVGLAVFLLAGAFIVLNTSWFQNKLLERVTVMLTDKLETKVEIDSVSVELLTLDAELYGLTIEDRQHRKMLQMKLLKADVDVWPLLEKEVRISEVKVKDIRAELYKIPHDSIDSVANFQFVIDAFKKDNKQPKTKSQKPKAKSLKFMVNKLTAEHIDVKFNNNAFSLGKLLYTQPRHSTPKVKVEQLEARWERVNKKGYTVSHEARIGTLSAQFSGLTSHLSPPSQSSPVAPSSQLPFKIDISQLHFRNDNHHPRKNMGKPKRGFFDAEHFNVLANLKLEVDYAQKDSVHGILKEMTVVDSIMGIDIRDLHGGIAYSNKILHFTDMVVRQKDTELKFDSAFMQLPDKKNGTPLTYRTSTIKGHAILRDISRTFAPVLGDFTLPLDLSVRMEGSNDTITFRDVVVTRPGGLLTVKAAGSITGLKDKYKLRVHFDVSDMVAKGGEKERIISQFPVKKLMMKQLHALGTIRYKGSFNVLWKKEEFQGVLNTKVGFLNFYFAIDENNKYLQGRAQTNGLKLGEALDMPQIGPVSAVAQFKIDISKPRTALMRRKLGGKLPIGEVTAKVSEASYKFVKTQHLDVDIVSNGAVAEGSLQAPGKRVDLSCTFSFTNTNDLKKMKVKPGIKFHKLSDADKAAKAEEKAARKAAKEELRQQKQQEKEARKQQKAAAKAQKKQQKEEERQRKASSDNS